MEQAQYTVPYVGYNIQWNKLSTPYPMSAITFSGTSSVHRTRYPMSAITFSGTHILCAMIRHTLACFIYLSYLFTQLLPVHFPCSTSAHSLAVQTMSKKDPIGYPPYLDKNTRTRYPTEPLPVAALLYSLQYHYVDNILFSLHHILYSTCMIHLLRTCISLFFIFFTKYTTYSSEGEKTTEYTITKQQGE